MATILLHPATEIQPPEYTSTALVACATCGSQWDEDDDTDKFDLVDGDPHCTDSDGAPSCFETARAIACRKRVAEVATKHLAAAIKEIESIEQDEFKGFYVDAHDHPACILDDALGRVKLYGEGKDSGWRNGLMLGSMEAFYLTLHLEESIRNDSFKLTWELGLHPEQPQLRIGEFVAGIRARELARAAVTLMDLSRYSDRTRKGEEVA